VQGIGFEAGLVLPFATYAVKGGFKKEAITHETSAFLPLTSLSYPVIKGTVLETSIRRHLDRLPDYGYNGVWTKATFTAMDRCRTDETFGDMSDYRLQEVVRESAPEFAQTVLSRLFMYGLTKHQKIGIKGDDAVGHEEAIQEITAKVQRVGHMTQFVLDRIIEMPDVSEHLFSHYFTEAEVRQRAQVARFRLLESDRIMDDLIRKYV
jgi:hypothetical protein